MVIIRDVIILHTKRGSKNEAKHGDVLLRCCFGSRIFDKPNDLVVWDDRPDRDNL